MGVLKARVGGVWVPVSQGFSAAQVGYVASHQLTAGFSTVATHTTFQDEGLTVTINEQAGHIYKATLMVQGIVNGGANGMFWQLARNGVAVRSWGVSDKALDGAWPLHVTLEHVWVGQAGTGVVFKSQVRGTTANTVVTSNASAAEPRMLLIEDITQVQPADTSMTALWKPVALWAQGGSGATSGTTPGTACSLTLPARPVPGRWQLSSLTYLGKSVNTDQFFAYLQLDGAARGQSRADFGNVPAFMAVMSAQTDSLAANAAHTATVAVARQTGTGTASWFNDYTLNSIQAVFIPD